MPRHWDNKEYYEKHFAAKENVYKLRREFITRKPENTTYVKKESNYKGKKPNQNPKPAFGPDR